MEGQQPSDFSRSISVDDPQSRQTNQQRQNQGEQSRFLRAKSVNPESEYQQPSTSWQKWLSPWRVLPETGTQRSLSDSRMRASASEIEGRSYVGVLSRISCMLSSAGLQTPAARNTGGKLGSAVRTLGTGPGRPSGLDLRQHWLPDSVSRECYDCCDKFTTFRRRHHCRICGQIFCSRCCNQQIAGCVLGSVGVLRVCTYCSKVVMTYVQSIVEDGGGSALMPDLSKVLERVSAHLETAKQLGGESTAALACTTKQQKRGVVVAAAAETERLRRASSISHDETLVDSTDALDQDLTYLTTLVHMVIDPIHGVGLASHRHRLKSYRQCLVGSEVVDWLVKQRKCSKRWQAVAIGQRLVESGLLECASHSDQTFRDDYLLYRPSSTALRRPAITRPPDDHPIIIEEPHWLSQIELKEDESQSQVSSDDVLREQTVDINATSSSSYDVRLDLASNAVSMSRAIVESGSSLKLHQSSSPCSVTDGQSRSGQASCTVALPPRFLTEPSAVDADECRRRASEECGVAFESVESLLLSQLLDAACLSAKWYDTIIDLSRMVCRQVRPDVRHEADLLDIGNYVKYKRIPGGRPTESSVVSGVAFTHTVVHNEMRSHIVNPQILLINGSIAYQRYQDRLTSLEPMIMQEKEVLKNMTKMLVSFSPDVIVVENHVESLARDMLRTAGVTLMSNTKVKNLYRISRCTQAGIIGCAGVQLTQPSMGICHQFYIKQFTMEGGGKKSVVFFDGCPSHLGCTVLLRGGHMNQLRRVKQVLRFMIFVQYNWLLLRSYFRDLSALPPSFGSRSLLNERVFPDKARNNCTSDSIIDDSISDVILLRESFNDKKVLNSDNSHSLKSSSQIDDIGCFQKCSAELSSQRLSTEIVTDKSDPLQCEIVPTISPDRGSLRTEIKTVSGDVSDFRYILADNVVCTTPYSKVSVPYLESDEGRHCSLRRFFPSDLYWSLEFNRSERIRRCTIRKAPIENKELFADTQKHILLSCDLYRESMHCNSFPQSIVSDFRAKGNNFKPWKDESNEQKSHNVGISKESELEHWVLPYDCLSPLNHQRLIVHSYSYCKLASGECIACNDSQLNVIRFNGDQDSTLGLFLEVHCFSDYFKCMRKLCDYPAEAHVQSFLHDDGCILRTQRSLVEPCPDSRIWLWTRCNRCGIGGCATPMSEETWTLSFGKFLETFFLCEHYTFAEGCGHSLFRDYTHFFALGTKVVIFKYNTIKLNEVVLPPDEVKIDLKMLFRSKLNDTLLSLSKCVRLFSNVLEKLLMLHSLCSDAKVSELIRIAQMDSEDEKVAFRKLLSDIEVMASDCMEKFTNDPDPDEDRMFSIVDRSVLARRVIAESARKWRARLVELSKTIKSISRSKTEETSHGGVDKEQRKSTSGRAINDESVFEEYSTHSEGAEAEVFDQETGKVTSARIKTLRTGPIKALKSLSWSHDEFSEKFISPLGENLHYRLPPTDPPCYISGEDLGSIISYCLLTPEYSSKLKGIQDQISRQSEETVKTQSQDETLLSTPKRVVSRLRYASGNSSVIQSESGNSSDQTDLSEKSMKHMAQIHVDINISDESANFYCQIMLAEHFRHLREIVFPGGEERFVRSLMQCSVWNAKGGKSGSTFQKSSDDRFVIKTISRIEKDHFVRIGPKYVEYVLETLSKARPSALAKVLGVFLVGYKNNITGLARKAYVIVMENLFYGYNVSQKFDLKGSLRNRLADTSEHTEVVLMDQNIISALNEKPFYVRTHSKRILMEALSRDTYFLQSCQVMDYSLLVAIDESCSCIAVGLIDYLRSYTYDKAMETYIKSYNILLGDGENRPTVLDPVRYKTRFLDMMSKYFTDVPDRWAGFAMGVGL